MEGKVSRQHVIPSTNVTTLQEIVKTRRKEASLCDQVGASWAGNPAPPSSSPPGSPSASNLEARVSRCFLGKTTSSQGVSWGDEINTKCRCHCLANVPSNTTHIFSKDFCGSTSASLLPTQPNAYHGSPFCQRDGSGPMRLVLGKSAPGLVTTTSFL